MDAERKAFEADAEPMGFDLTRQNLAAPEPWCEYEAIDTGHRWGGWLARAALSQPHASAQEAAPSYEHQRAIMEGHRVYAADRYFNARNAMLDTRDRRNVFDAGFNAGWDAPHAPAPVPAEPPPGLLMSMALRYDHGLGCPGYYDSAIFASSGMTHAKRLDATLRTMRQLWEEVSGNGFYRPEKEAEYADMLGGIAGTSQSGEGG